MLLVPCPWCGARSEAEFTYIRASQTKRPATGDLSAENTEQQALLDYVYLRDNPKGMTQEYWQHSGGCRGIFKVERNNVTHEITASVKRDGALPSELNGEVEGAGS